LIFDLALPWYLAFNLALVNSKAKLGGNGLTG